MDCSHQDLDGVRVIRLAGRMDIEGNERIALQLTVAARGGSAVIVDLTGVDFLASVGIGTLVGVAQSARLQKRRLVLCGAGEQVRRTLERTSIPEIIDMYGDLAEARAALAGPTAE